MSITTAIEGLQGRISAAYTALQAKGATIPTIQNTANLSAAIDSIPAGGGGGVDLSKSIKFRDCDGTVLHSYTTDEIASMTELPALPTKPGLTCQGWNWTLQQIKDYAAAYGKCEVGATYTTDDGKTRITLTIQDPKYSEIPLVFQQTAANGVEVDWGDGSATQTYASTSQQTISHQYSPTQYPVTYTVKFKVNSGTMSFPSYIMGKSGTESATNPIAAWTNMIDSVNIGSGVTSIGSNAFRNCYSLASITIPSSVTSIGSQAFRDCKSLASITIPSGVTSIGDSVFQYCYSLASITIPNSVTSIGTYAFYNCYSLISITIPNDVTSIGSSAFSGCYSLISITIPNDVTSIGSNAFYQCYSLASITIPSGVTSIGDSVFQYCYSLVSITIPSSVTSIGSNAFQFCLSLASITIPNSVTSIGTYAFRDCQSLVSITIQSSVTSIESYTFNNCYSLASITIPSSVTSIGNSTFNGCSSLASITIPSNVTSIGSNVFSGCYGIKTFDFRTFTSVPSLANVNAFQNTPTSREIVVPDELYDTWITATNWNSSTNGIVSSIVKASESTLGPLT